MDGGRIDESMRVEAAATADNLRVARRAIDAEFGAGFAAANPSLVAAFVQACAIEGLTVAGREATRDALSTATRLSRDTNETLLKLKPRLFG